MWCKLSVGRRYRNDARLFGTRNASGYLPADLDAPVYCAGKERRNLCTIAVQSVSVLVFQSVLVKTHNKEVEKLSPIAKSARNSHIHRTTYQFMAVAGKKYLELRAPNRP